MQELTYLPYRRKRSRVPVFLAVLGIYFLVALLGTAISYLDVANSDGWVSKYARVKRTIEDSEDAPVLNCTPQGVDHFPADLFTLEQRQQGAVVIHVLAALYIFAAIAIICDDYFVPSLESLCEALKIQPDVAGATFMAAGSSAPELFTAVIGLFLAQSDVGVASIVGSAVFNILAIVAVCGLFAGSVIPLTWWPVTRDSIYYMLSIGALAIVMADEKIHWYEAMILLIMYIIYIIIMYFNPRLGTFAITTVAKLRGKQPAENSVHTPLLDERAVTNEDQIENAYLKSNETILWEKEQENKKTAAEKRLDESDTTQEKVPSDDYQSPLTPPSGCLKNTSWVLMLPATLLFLLSIPDCRRPGCWKKLYMLTFTMSIVWIAGISYVMVWMVTMIGDTLNIPDTVMGLTLLAAGTSVPDMLASLFVARDGYGDMAISNSIGSNVFDILLCLGLPWFIQTAIVEPNSIVVISSSGMEFTCIGLLGTILFLLIALSVTGWKLNKVFGLVCFLAYVVVITLSCLYELNVFGKFNPPPCPR